jgi:hypothetical protein
MVVHAERRPAMEARVFRFVQGHGTRPLAGRVDALENSALTVMLPPVGQTAGC